MPAAAKVAPAKLAPKPAMKPATKPAAPKLVPAKPAAAKPHMPAPIQKLAAGSQPHAAPAAALPAFARLAAPSPATKPHLPVAHAPLTHTKSAAPTMPPLIRATLPATPQAEPYPVAPHLLPHPHKAQTRHPEPSHHASVHPSTHPKARPRLLPLTPRTHTLGSGQPLAAHIQNAIEHSLHVDLSSVRVHHDHVAQAKAMQLSARAFTYGHDIFLGPGEHPHDLPLLAHEAAHVVQQQAAASPQAWSTGSTFASNNHFEHEAVQASSAVQRGESFNVQQRVSTPSVQRLGISDALDYFAGAANNLPGFSMLTVVIGFNPINMANVERSPANILRAVVEFIPGGHQVTEALNKYGVFEKVGNWIADQLKALGDIGHALHVALDKFLDSLSWKDIFHLGDLWDRFVTTFTAPIDRIKSFLGGLVTGIWDLVRPLILKPLAALAESVGAWPLLCAVMGKNPITGEKVDSSADALIGGFMHLIGQDEIYTNIKKANAGARALAWFKTAMSGMVALVSSIPDRFMALVKSFEWSDILDLPSGFRKVASAFGSFAKDFFTWAGTTIWDLLQIIFEVVAPAVMPYLQKLGASFKSILKNPMGFVRNLVAAGKLGFQMFWQRFGEHLKKGFIEWLTGSMPGIYIPKAFTLEEIVKFVLSVLGLTWANIRGKLVKVVGETAVVAMEKGFAIVQTLVKDGPAAAWEQIKGELGNLRDLVFQSVMSFLVETVITKAVEKLASLLVPAAAFIQAILSIYNTIMVFVQKLAKIIQVVKAFLDGMMEIAAGSIGGAAAKVESTLAGLLALSINFLAGFLGLNNVAAKVMGIINDKVRAPIDKALYKAIAWIVAMAKKLGDKLSGKKDKPKQGDGTDSSAVIQAVKQDLNQRGRDLESADAFTSMIDQVSKSHPGLSAIRVRRSEEGTYVIEASASPFTFVGVVNEYVKTDYGSVVGTVAFDDVIFGEPAYNGHGMHAEDKIIGFVRSRLNLLAKQKSTLPKKVEIYVSQSPCKTKCTPNLIGLKSSYPSVDSWAIYYSYEHLGTSGKHAKDSEEALRLLAKAGFHVLQFDKALELEKKGKTP
jgi:hypothetical protein